MFSFVIKNEMKKHQRHDTTETERNKAFVVCSARLPNSQTNHATLPLIKQQKDKNKL
jgi:hypothetical protein